MTDKPTPTDAEIDALNDQFLWNTTEGRRDTARAVLAKWGTPAGAGAPVAPDFYTACAGYEGGGEAGWMPLPGYSNETEHGVRHLVLEAARKEGYKGTAAGRLLELGWEIRPVYLTPQPAQTQAVPMTSRQISDTRCAALDPDDWPEPWAFTQGVRAAEKHHSIKGGQHGTE